MMQVNSSFDSFYESFNASTDVREVKQGVMVEVRIQDTVHSLWIL
jgi:hypothetical protein